MSLAQCVEKVGAAAGLSEEVQKEAREIVREIMEAGARYHRNEYDAIAAGALYVAATRRNSEGLWAALCAAADCPKELAEKKHKFVVRNIHASSALPLPLTDSRRVEFKVQERLIMLFSTNSLKVRLDNGLLSQIYSLPGRELSEEDFGLLYAHCFYVKEGQTMRDRVSYESYVYKSDRNLGLPDKVLVTELEAPLVLPQRNSCRLIALAEAAVQEDMGALGFVACQPSVRQEPLNIIRGEDFVAFFGAKGHIFVVGLKELVAADPAVGHFIAAGYVGHGFKATDGLFAVE